MLKNHITNLNCVIESHTKRNSQQNQYGLFFDRPQEIGTRIYKQFGNKKYKGIVISYDDERNYYKVV